MFGRACSPSRTCIAKWLRANHTDTKAYSKTLLLPHTSFPLWTDHSKTELTFRQKSCEDLYNWQWENAEGPLFVLHDGPPYANGHLHMGHALNKVIKDVINRYHVSLGHRVHFVPGWDCHGLPIENKALKDLGQSSQSLPPSKIRAAARQTALEQIEVQRKEIRQLGIMANWDDGNGIYRTLDPEYEMRQLEVFKKMVEKDLIHRDHRPVYYSPSSRSALAEAELKYKDTHVSHSVYIAFKVNNANAALKEIIKEQGGKHVSLLVWTTTPWTLSANMGIAVNLKMSYSILKMANRSDLVIVATDRISSLNGILGTAESISEILGRDLVDVTYDPIFSLQRNDTNEADTLKVIAASHVTAESGTGLVHCAPAHGAEDYNAFRSLGLLSSSSSSGSTKTSQNMICHVDGEGKFTSDIVDIVGADASKSLIGQEVLKGGGKAVVELLRGMGDSVLLGVEKIKHRYPYDWKTGEPVIVTATSQWFANLDKIKDDALQALERVSFFPSISRNRLESFVRSRSEWCISRQRVWGVPIPSLHHIPTSRSVLTAESLSYIISVLKEKGEGTEYWWKGPIEEFIPPALRDEPGFEVDEWVKGADTMDVWFDSGTSWSLLEDLTANANGEREFKADVCLEGSDQHRGWFQSQLLTAVGSAGIIEKGSTSPYRTLITHGMVLDQKGKKMSKSDGNIISPLTVIHGGKDKKKEPAYGTDVLRLWAASVDYQRDMPLGQHILTQTAESMRKIRNSARFILGNIGGEGSRRELRRVHRDDMNIVGRYIMHELYTLEKTALDGYQAYNFPKVINALNNFANTTLSSFYFDITKDCLYTESIHSEERRGVVTVLEQVLKTMTSVMAPVLPHLAEEIHSVNMGNPDNATCPSFFTKRWAPLGQEWKLNETDMSKWEMCQHLRVRGVVQSLLEKARAKKQLKSSLEAQVDILVGPDGDKSKYISNLRNYHSRLDVRHNALNWKALKSLFIVSDLNVREGEVIEPTPDWQYSGSVPLEQYSSEDGDGEVVLTVRIRPATLAKCPRCWTFSRPEEEPVCKRCATALDT